MKHFIFIKFRSVKIAVMTICLFGIFFGISGMRVKADEPLIIVIDPGHSLHERSQNSGIREVAQSLKCLPHVMVCISLDQGVAPSGGMALLE